MTQKQQVVVIHGGTTFDSQEEYLQFLKEHPIEIERLRFRQDWKDSLQERLGDNFDVLQPRMPNITNAKYNEWSIWFENILTFLDKDIILVGHSLGGVFLVKFLSEHLSLKSIKALFLIAAPFEDAKESLASFRIEKSFEQLNRQVENIFLYYSRDDKVVPLSHARLYEESLPMAVITTFEDRGHFKQPEFPELVAAIQSFHE